MLTFAALRNEIVSGPLASGLATPYSQGDDVQVANMLNTFNQIGPIPMDSVIPFAFSTGILGSIEIGKATPVGQVIPTSSGVTQTISSLKTYYNISYLLNSSIFTAMDTQQIDPLTGNTIYSELTGFLTLVGAATNDAVTYLSSLAQNRTSRAMVAFGQSVTPSDVCNARLGNTP